MGILPAIIMLGVTLRWTSSQSRVGGGGGGSNVFSGFMLRKPELSACTDGPLGS